MARLTYLLGVCIEGLIQSAFGLLRTFIPLGGPIILDGGRKFFLIFAMRWEKVILALLAVCGAAELFAAGTEVSLTPQAATIKWGEIPPGLLGFVVGTNLTIEGAKPETSQDTDRVLLVDTVNDRTLEPPVLVNLHDSFSPITDYKTEAARLAAEARQKSAVALPEGVRYLLHGHEHFGIDGLAMAEARATQGVGNTSTLDSPYAFLVTEPPVALPPRSAKSSTMNELLKPTPVVGTPIGCLGFPFGQFLKIEGVCHPPGLSHGNSRVDTVNGFKLSAPVDIIVEFVLPPTESIVYKVRPGDTLIKIAKQLNMPMEKIFAFNPLRDPNFVRAGDVLFIPTKVNLAAGSRFSVVGYERFMADLAISDSGSDWFVEHFEVTAEKSEPPAKP